MISVNNRPLNALPNDNDFTVDHYKVLLDLAVNNYPIARYSNIPYGERFLLWRHDCDYSLNRALMLAKLENAAGVTATYFVNIHCEFYNLFERNQLDILHQIVALGHDIGLHFDAAFYQTTSETELESQVKQEADLLESFVGVRPTAFSFHNPTAAHLCCEAEQYAGLVNCYSRLFKSSVSYCSDSNGYWRFRRLFDVLESGADSSLQVLTHPGWWQDKAMPPRQRIFRSVYGRAEAVMHQYDEGLQVSGRENYSGNADALLFLLKYDSSAFYFFDYLWNNNKLDALFIQLWCLHQQQIKQICFHVIENHWGVPSATVARFFEQLDNTVAVFDLFNVVFDFASYQNVVGGDDESIYLDLSEFYHMLTSWGGIGYSVLEQNVSLLCHLILSIANWAEHQSSISYSGLTGMSGLVLFEELINKSSENIYDDFKSERWDRLKAKINSLCSDLD